MKRITGMLLLITTSLFPFVSHRLMAPSEEADIPNIVQRTQSAAEVLEEMMGAPDQGIPREILDSAECVAHRSLDAQRRVRARGQMRERRRQLSYPKWVEWPGSLPDRGRKLGIADRSTGSGPGNAGHELHGQE